MFHWRHGFSIICSTAKFKLTAKKTSTLKANEEVPAKMVTNGKSALVPWRHQLCYNIMTWWINSILRWTPTPVFAIVNEYLWLRIQWFIHKYIYIWYNRSKYSLHKWPKWWKDWDSHQWFDYSSCNVLNINDESSKTCQVDFVPYLKQ